MRQPDDKNPVPDARWRALDEEWYKAGRRYREFPVLPGPYSAVFRNWLNHPTYDRYWQKLIPFREEFSRITIPVLTMTGYYSGGASGALYYFNQHHRYNPRANHTLLIGPWDERGMPRGAPSWVRGYQLDTAAIVDRRDLRYEWLGYALKDGQKPQLLAERVNYQLAGANEWRHAPSLASLEQDRLRFFLEGSANGDRNRMLESKNAEVTFLPQTFDFADRSDPSWTPAPELVLRRLEPHNGEFFVSEPLKQPLDVAGLFTGYLDFSVNKMDVDVTIAFYELLPSGEYVKLFDPAYAFRASYARDRTKRQLLRAGVRQQLTFRSERMMARRLQAGSRMIMLLGVNKRPDQQINYGTGDDVSEESIEDADVPLRIRWYNSSYIDIPVRR
jgi:predicted acyl esterase